MWRVNCATVVDLSVFAMYMVVSLIAGIPTSWGPPNKVLLPFIVENPKPYELEGILGYIFGFYRDNGKENGNYHIRIG